ncbi:unnamed protein product [Camellia sinensis]
MTGPEQGLVLGSTGPTGLSGPGLKTKPGWVKLSTSHFYLARPSASEQHRPQTSIYVMYSLPIIDQFEDTDLDSASNSSYIEIPCYLYALDDLYALDFDGILCDSCGESSLSTVKDSFYHGLTTEEAQRVHEYNFDHPDAFDSEQLVECIEKLKSVQSVQVPIYDFKNHHSKKKATPADVDLSISNNGNIYLVNMDHSADGKEVEVIDLESDSLQADLAFNNSDRKHKLYLQAWRAFLIMHRIPMSCDVQDGYGLMISALIGTEISNCSSVPADISSLHNEMTLNNGEEILGNDESIYMSLREISISMPEI